MSKTTIFQSRMRDFDPTDGGGLNLDVKSGRIRDDNTITDKADQTVALTDNATNFVELDSVGAATANTSAFTTGRIPIATVVTSGADITSITDRRAWVAADGGGGGAPTGAQYVVLAADGTLTDERVLTAGDQITLVDAGAGAALTVDVKDISARVFNSANISIANNTNVVLTFNSERFDTQGLHSTSVNTGRLTAPVTGKYYVTFHLLWGTSATGLRNIEIDKNGTVAVAKIGRHAGSTDSQFQGVSTIIDLTAGEWVQVLVIQTSGGALNAVANNDQSLFFAMIRIA